MHTYTYNFPKKIQNSENIKAKTDKIEYVKVKTLYKIKAIIKIKIQVIE